MTETCLLERLLISEPLQLQDMRLWNNNIAPYKGKAKTQRLRVETVIDFQVPISVGRD